MVIELRRKSKNKKKIAHIVCEVMKRVKPHKKMSVYTHTVPHYYKFCVCEH